MIKHLLRVFFLETLDRHVSLSFPNCGRRLGYSELSRVPIDITVDEMFQINLYIPYTTFKNKRVIQKLSIRAAYFWHKQTHINENIIIFPKK